MNVVVKFMKKKIYFMSSIFSYVDAICGERERGRREKRKREKKRIKLKNKMNKRREK